jgi:hypothetical protein
VRERFLLSRYRVDLVEVFEDVLGEANLRPEAGSPTAS